MPTKKPLTLSIVIPVYNEERYLGDCLKSIAGQTSPPDQVIVVDNNSTDQSIAIARKFKFVTIIEESQQGIVFARNKGFNASSGDIIGRIDADTHLSPDWVKTVKAKALTLKTDQAVTGPCSFYDAKVPSLLFGFHRIIYFWSSRLLFGHTILYGSNMFLFRENWLKIRQDTCQDNAIHEDMDLSSHVIKSGGRVYFSNQLKASASARRFRNWRYYPSKWIRTWLVHGLFTTRYKAIRKVYQSKEY